MTSLIFWFRMKPSLFVPCSETLKYYVLISQNSRVGRDVIYGWTQRWWGTTYFTIIFPGVTNLGLVKYIKKDNQKKFPNNCCQIIHNSQRAVIFMTSQFLLTFCDSGRIQLSYNEELLLFRLELKRQF